MLYALILLAQEDKPAADGPGPWGLMPFIGIVVLFYFLIIMPNRKEKQQRQAMMGTLKKNDKVITSGGIIGVVLNLKEGTEEVTIKSDDAKLLILRSSIARIITEPEKESSGQIKPAT